MKIDLDLRKLTDALVRVEAVADELPQVAQTVQQEALGHMVIAANRSVYDTTPGAYERTGELLRGLDARSRAAKNTAAVEVIGSAPHHAYVELGTGATDLSVPQAQQYALANPNTTAPLYLGRSGAKYSLPGPIVAPAQAFAFLRLQELFAQKVRGVVR